MRSKKDNFLEIIMIYRSISHIYHRKNNRNKYVHYLNKYMYLLKKLVGPRHPNFLRSSIEYTDILLDQKGLYKKSLKRLRNTKKELKTVFESNSFLKARYKLEKGIVYSYLSWTKKSLNKLEEAKSLYLENFGKNHPFYFNCCYSIGNTLNAQGYHDEALAIYKTVFEGLQRLYFSIHINTSPVLLLIAYTYSKKGIFSCSLQYYKKTLAIYKELNFQNTYEMKNLYLSIARLYLEITEYKTFFYYFKKSRKIKIKDKFGRHHYYDILFNLIRRYFNQTENYQACRRISMKMFKMLINSDRYNKSRAIELVTYIARTEILIGGERNYHKANKLFLLSKDLYAKLIEKHKIPEKNLLIVDIYKLKAELYILLGKHEDSLNTLRHTLNLMRHFYNKNDYQMLGLYRQIRSVLSIAKRHHERMQISKRIIKIELKTFKHLMDVFVIYFYIAYEYIRLDRYDKALEYSKRSLRMNKRIDNKKDINLRNSYFLTGICYLEQYQHNQALIYFIKALFSRKLSRNVNRADCCVWNNIACLYANKGMLYEALNVYRSVLESAKSNNLPRELVQTVTLNLQDTEKAIEIQPNYATSKTLKLDLRIIIGSLLIKNNQSY